MNLDPTLSEDTNKTAPAERLEFNAAETPDDLMRKVTLAKAERKEYVETTPEVIQHFNRTGLNGAEYFILHGIKVFPYGKTDQILEKENEYIGRRLHGASEGIPDRG